MFANQNRFAMLSMDDDDDENYPPALSPTPAPTPAPTSPGLPPNPSSSDPTVRRKWNLDEGRPETIREWHLEGSKPRGRRGPFSRYAFHDDDNSKSRLPKTYAFRDESPPAETKKPVTPEPSATNFKPIAPLTTDKKSVAEEDFPKLSDYVRPTTPPYPPDDGWYPTLAERIRVAMERKENSAKVEDKKVFTMDYVIPMPTRVGATISLQ